MWPKTKKAFLTFVVACICFLFLYWGFASTRVALPKKGKPPTLYANQCDDDLRRIYLAAIGQAQESIVLFIYSMTDRYIIDALQNKAKEGIRVTVIHDAKTHQFGFNRLGTDIARFMKGKNGLMHKKILIIDEKMVFLGSTNLTSTSLKVHDNLIMGCYNRRFAKAILGKHPFLQMTSSNTEHLFFCGGQKMEFWSFPEEGKEGLQLLINFIDNAKSSLKVAMFTWTHPQLTEAMIRAHNRGIDVEIVIDRNQGMGVSKKSIRTLIASHVPTFLGINELLHHKMAIIDDSTLVIGSANWTRAAFTRNEDCIFVMHELTSKQKQKLDHLWKVIRHTREPINLSDEKHLMIFGQRPKLISNISFQCIPMAA